MQGLENLPPFYPGQKVVCVKSHQDGYVMYGQSYIVRSCNFHACCRKYRVEIEGVVSRNTFHQILPLGTRVLCGCCMTPKISSGFLPFKPESFAPIQESPFPSLTYKKVVEKECEVTSMN